MESRTVELKINENCVTGDGFLSNDPGTDGLQICLSYIFRFRRLEVSLQRRHSTIVSGSLKSLG